MEVKFHHMEKLNKKKVKTETKSFKINRCTVISTEKNKT